MFYFVEIYITDDFDFTINLCCCGLNGGVGKKKFNVKILWFDQEIIKMGDDTNDRTLWCGNLSDAVTEELLFELFLQVKYEKLECLLVTTIHVSLATHNLVNSLLSEVLDHQVAAYVKQLPVQYSVHFNHFQTTTS